MTTTKRATVRQILNRDKVYNLSFYARKLGKKIGSSVSVNEIKTCLSHMAKADQLTYQIVNDRYVVGFTLPAVA